jgi:hypothetical protein
MKYELSESIKSQLIEVLNNNIRLNEAAEKNPLNTGSLNVAPQNDLETSEKNKKKKDNTEAQPSKSLGGQGDQAGHGSPTPEKTKPTHSLKDITLGNQPSNVPFINKELDIPTVAGMVAGGKAAGKLADTLGGNVAQAVTNKLGGSKLAGMLGIGVGDLTKKLGLDVETLSGSKTFMAQLGDIAPHQAALRWEGSGTPGWFRPMIPSSQISPTKVQVIR